MATNSTNPSYESQADFIPWKWYITPDLEHFICPSTSSILGTFAIVNVAVSLLNLIFGNRKVVHFISCGLFGSPNGRETWWFMFLIPLATQVGANVFIAYTYKHTPGYTQGFSILDIVLFYTARPRLGWFILTTLMDLGRIEDVLQNARNGQPTGNGDEENIELMAGRDTTMDSGASYASGRRSSRQSDTQSLIDKGRKTPQKGFYEATAKGAIVTEIILLLGASYYWGLTAHFGVTRGFYHIGHLKGSHATNAAIMYAGAMLSLIYVGYSVIFLGSLLFSERKSDKDEMAESLFVAYFVGASSWLGSWLFWAGYIRLAGDLYCPPKLIESGAIWTGFSVIGTFFGGGI